MVMALSGKRTNCAAKSAADRRSPAPMKSSLPVELLEDCEAVKLLAAREAFV
jgi:hypothetical protein